jgi:hypothetical protein
VQHIHDEVTQVTVKHWICEETPYLTCPQRRWVKHQNTVDTSCEEFLEKESYDACHAAIGKTRASTQTTFKILE